MKPIGDESWCLRLEEAVLEGRFLEDPGFWRPHVEQCSTCREVVEGVFLLRDSIGRARMDDDLTETAPLDGDRVIAGALGRHRAERRRQVVLWSLGGALVLVLGDQAVHSSLLLLPLMKALPDPHAVYVSKRWVKAIGSQSEPYFVLRVASIPHLPCCNAFHTQAGTVHQHGANHR